MDMIGADRVRAELHSKQWSTRTLNEGIRVAHIDCKSEPWLDGEDDANLLKYMED